MRIAYLCSSFYQPSETFIRDLAAALSQGDDHVRIFADRVTEAGRQLRSLDVHELRFHRRASRPAKLATLASKYFPLMQRFSQLRLDVEYATPRLHSALQAFAPDVVYADYGINGILAARAADQLRCPLVIHFHGYDASQALGDAEYRFNIHQLLEKGARCIVPSHHLRRRLLIEFGAHARVDVVPCFPVADRSLLATGIQKTPWPSIISLGRLTGKKNPLALLEAFRLVKDRIPAARFTIIGEGDLGARSRERAQQLHFGAELEFKGALPHAEAMTLLRSHWIFAQHSVTANNGDQEGLPVSILEAMLLGTPVVTTIHSGITEVIRHGETGLLCQEHDFETMADHLIALLTCASERDRLAMNAKVAIETLVTNTPRAATIREMLQAVISSL
jgi:colanic acid/amylovoran biosynthesis glycosyltransferase